MYNLNRNDLNSPMYHLAITYHMQINYYGPFVYYDDVVTKTEVILVNHWLIINGALSNHIRYANSLYVELLNQLEYGY